jgi:membrane-associated phospholipid phosphatase
VALLLLSVGMALPVRGSVLDAGPSDRVALDLPVDAVITGVGFVGTLVPVVFKNLPAKCHWCDGPVSSSGPNAVDFFFHDALTGTLVSRQTADTLSSVTAYVLAPALALGAAFTATGPYATDGAGWRAAVIVAEATAVTGALTQTIKIITARNRPYVHYGPSSAILTDADAHRGFPSGHTSIAAALGTAVATTATLEESPAAPWLWGAAAALTVSTATFRMMADQHYFTDVLAGAVLGSACGVVVPLLHRRGSLLGGPTTSATVAPRAGGLNLSVSGMF